MNRTKLFCALYGRKACPARLRTGVTRRSFKGKLNWNQAKQLGLALAGLAQEMRWNPFRRRRNGALKRGPVLGRVEVCCGVWLNDGQGSARLDNEQSEVFKSNKE